MTLLRLRDDVLILPYDEHDDSQRFVAGVDGRQFVISAGLAVLLDEMRAPATLERLAQRTSERTGVCITAAELEMLLRERVPPMLFQADCDPQPIMAPLRFRLRCWSAESLIPLLRCLRGMFTWRVAIALIAAFLCVEIVIASQMPATAPHEISSRDTALGIALALTGMAFHELGHLAACHRFGLRHGGVGIGVYWCIPVVYAEAHGTWFMPSMHRAVVHGAGVYFQCVYVALIGGLYVCSGSPALLIAITWSHLLVLHAINPMFRLDGYWLLTDLTGAPDLHRRVGDVARAAWDGTRPARNDLTLAGAFAAGSGAYFSYLFHALAQGLAGTASAISLSWSGKLSDISGRSIALAFCVVVIISLARTFARSLRSLFSERADGG